MMIRHDGNYKIYIIQFKYNNVKNDKNEEWFNAGNCGQFLPRVFLNEKENIYKKVPLDDLNACGQCWQETGIYGTYNYDVAETIMLYIAKLKKGTEFRVCEVNINQTTKQISKVLF